MSVAKYIIPLVLVIWLVLVAVACAPWIERIWP